MESQAFYIFANLIPPIVRCLTLDIFLTARHAAVSLVALEFVHQDTNNRVSSVHTQFNAITGFFFLFFFYSTRMPRAS